MNSAVSLPAAGVASSNPRRAAVSTALAAVGIVFGDLGTSPLYTYQTIVSSVGGHASVPVAMGLLSLVVWALIITVFDQVLRVRHARRQPWRRRHPGADVAVGRQPDRRAVGRLRQRDCHGLVWRGADLWRRRHHARDLGLSALEGVNVVDRRVQALCHARRTGRSCWPCSQRSARDRAASVGPSGRSCCCGSSTIAVLGLAASSQRPRSYWPSIRATRSASCRTSGLRFSCWAACFSASPAARRCTPTWDTSARSPIRSSWYCIVLPALLLSYAGQTALLIEQPMLDGNPFFQLAPDWAIYPLVVLATVATIIASQAIITGSFSMTRQAMQLGWLPGVNIRQTSDDVTARSTCPW